MRKAQTIVLLTFIISFFSFAQAAEEKLLWHNVQLDKDGKLLSWVNADSSYDKIVCLAWDAFKKIPVQPNGYKTYFSYPVFYSGDGGQNLFGGRDWTHNPASLFAMLTDSAILYYAYSGDGEVMPLIKAVLDHHIAKGSTKPADVWAEVPYASSNGGEEFYRGADDKKYIYGEEGFLGRGDGIGFIEPDKVGELGLAYLKYYEYSLDKKYLKAAKKCADALVKNFRSGDASHSPWPFRVDAATGKKVREEYTSNTVGPIKLFDEMIRLNIDDVKKYRKTRDAAFEWLMKYPVQNSVWTQYFEDIYIYPDYRTNINQYCPMETTRYLLENPQYDPNWRQDCERIIKWVQKNFACDSLTMAGLPEKGIQWGAEAISEQVNDMDKMSSHTARYASVLALWYENTGDTDAKERAFRSFNWASYSCKENGLVKTSIDEGTGYWFSDGYGDYMRHFLRGMASVPAWAPKNENHLLRSSSVIQSIKYKNDEIEYKTFDKKSEELFKLRQKPKGILVGGKEIASADYMVEPIDGGGFAVKIKHSSSEKIKILF